MVKFVENSQTLLFSPADITIYSLTEDILYLAPARF